MADDDNPSFNGGNFNSRPRLAGVVAGPSTKLVVTNLHYEISSKDLTAIFGQIGTLVSEPQIRYDRSGRSSGTATVAFETLAEATRAKNQYDGILAKGQPMSIAFDVAPPRQPRTRSSSAPTTSTASLLARIQKPPLLDRLSGGSKDDSALPSRAPCARRRRRGPDPHHTRDDTARGARGGNGGRGGGGRGTGAARNKDKKPKTAADLDKELDAFMGDTPASASAPVEGTGAAAPAQDVEMA
ncbi:hypothetical protein K438DRAFT_1936583 [Mycena galopus ATCC 62051]|nr:hypothetical protein K438DRAFT_1936583 [Mycena galopus ATCC 62051]